MTDSPGQPAQLEWPARPAHEPFAEDAPPDAFTIAQFEALLALPPKDAAAVLLHVVQGFSAPEVASVLSSTPAAIRQRLSRALRRLRTAYLAHNDSPRPLHTPAEKREDPTQ